MTKHGAAAAAFLIAVVATAGAAAPVAAAGPHDDLLAKEGARLAAAAGDPGAARRAGGRRRARGRRRPARAGGGGQRRHGPARASAGRGAGGVAAGAPSRAARRDARGAGAAGAAGSALARLRHRPVRAGAGELRRPSFPPEEERAPPELGRSYPGKARDVGWRSGDAAVRDGVLYLDGLIRPGQNAVAYVAAAVRSDRDRAAALRLGSPGPIKVWINGAPVFQRDVVRPAALDQDAVGVRLGRGWNRILIKTVVTRRRAGGSTRASPSRRGRRCSSTTSCRRRRRQDWARRERREGGGRRQPGAVARTARPAQAGGRRRRGWIWRVPRLEHAARQRRARGVFGVRTRAARGADRAGAAGRGRRRRGRRRGAPGAGGRAGAGAAARRGRRWCSPAWGGSRARARRDARALEMWRGALATDPACWLASLALAQEEADSGLPLAGTARLAALPAGRAGAAAHQARGDPPLHRGRQGGARPTGCWWRWRANGGATSSCCTSWRRAPARRGDGAEARARLAAAAALRPDVPSLEIELARLFEGDGERQRALATLDGGWSAGMPDEPATLVALGKLLHRHGPTARRRSSGCARR